MLIKVDTETPETYGARKFRIFLVQKQFRAVHRVVSLAFVAFWVVQALSGAFLVFHREIDDLATSAATRQLDPEALGRSIEQLGTAHPDKLVTAVFLTSDVGRHYDVTVENEATGTAEIIRVDGAGNVLLERPLAAPVTEGGIYMAANRLHRTLLAGEIGGWIVGISGLLLLTNILLGLKLAWPAARQWKKSLLPKRARSKPANLYGLHRALGLWIAPLALITVTCGVLLAFERGTGSVVGAVQVRPPKISEPAAAAPVSPSAAIRAGLRTFPEAEFSGMILPFGSRQVYQVHLRREGEPPQTHGATRAYVSANAGQVIGIYDPTEAPPANRFMGLLFPIHSGQIGGVAGRVIVLGIAIWLLTMIGLGLSLWSARRKLKSDRERKFEGNE